MTASEQARADASHPCDACGGSGNAIGVWSLGGMDSPKDCPVCQGSGRIDLASTEYFRAKGGHEAMPIFRSRWVLIPYKLAVEPLAAAWMERWIERRGGRTWAYAFRGVMWGSRVLVAVHNVRYGRSL